MAAGAVCKGRSASPALNRELRKSLANVLGCGIYSTPGYVRSKSNPADDPTRGKPLRFPDVELPAWWLASCCGDHSKLDEFLDSLELSSCDISGHPPLRELYIQDPSVVDLSCKHKKLKRMHQRVRLKLRLKAQSQKRVESETNGKNSFFSEFWSEEVKDVLLSFSKDQFIFGEGHSWPPSQPGFLDLFSGKKGFARACVKFGCPWVLTFDFKDGPHCDLLDFDLRKKIEFLVTRGVFCHVSAAPSSGSFSRAIGAAVRSRAEPQGIRPVPAGMAEEIRTGNSHSFWLAFIIQLCIGLKIHFWVSNPDGSYFWTQPEWKQVGAHILENCYRVDFCAFNTPWRKRTRFFTSGSLRGVKRLCNGKHAHLLLRGKDKKSGMSLTQVAAPYPRALCSLLAWHACKDARLLTTCTSLTCRHDHRRIGEAKNPGPRARRVVSRNLQDLNNVELVRAETAALGEKIYSQFLKWLELSLDIATIHKLFLVPALMGYMVAAYGKFLYAKGDALYTFRHLVVYVQRRHPGFKGFLQPSWEVVTRWEELEPVEHRRPLPYSLMTAMVTLCVAWKWHFVAGVILISFHGCCRPGEVLNACRSQLVLPCDLGNVSGPCYLRIQKPKPGMRGMGRIQHAKVAPADVVEFLNKVYRKHGPDVPLYGGTPSAFRLRWNKLLVALNVSKNAGITPGGLRAGGTVELYRRGVPILDILWALRLKHVETLQHYLQEIATQITMIDLPLETRVKVACLNELYPHFLLFTGH